MNRFVLAAVAAVAMFGWVTPAQATPITYTETFTGTGALGGTSFTDAVVTLTLTGDTSAVETGQQAGLCNPGPCGLANPGTATVDVSGVGTGTFTDSMVVWDTAFSSIAIFDLGVPGSTLYIGNAAFSSYGLTTSIGPITGSTAGGLFVHLFPTTSGDFTLTSVGDTASFTATELPTSPVPEPASLMLLGTGAVTLVGRRLRGRC